MIYHIVRYSAAVIFAAALLSLPSCQRENGTDELDWTLVWADEFDYSGSPDPDKWDYDLGDGCPELCGWGNKELQYYTDDPKNVRVQDGSLIIEVHNEKIKDRDFSSARLVSRGKSDWKYGRFEIRAKLPVGRGLWSAIWMLPTDTSPYGHWPKSGEIDIMENVGFAPDTVEATAHTGSFNGMRGTQKNSRHALEVSQKEFHTYSLEWDPDKYEVFVDDELVFTYLNEGNGYMEWPFDQSFYLILNIAYGGHWGGRMGIEPELLPQRMEVDYVRVYQKN